MKITKKEYYDVAVIGGGAAGLCFAVSLAKQAPNLSIAVLEALDRVGKKLAITGNGQCNITNKNLDLNRFHGANAVFSKTALSRFGFTFDLEFFKSIGVDIVFKQDGRAYPRSFQASSVVDALRFQAEELGVSLICSAKVTDFAKTNGLFTVTTENCVYSSKYLVVAAGLLSGGEKTGSFGNALRIVESMGHKTVKMTPSIVQLKTESLYLKRLKGIKVDAKATLKINNTAVAFETDEVLFTEYGLSGPAILKLSRETARTDKGCEISLDLVEDIEYDKLLLELKNRREYLKERKLEHFLTGMLQNRLGQTIIVAAALDLNLIVSSLTDNDLTRLAGLIKNFSFKVTGNTGFIHSQATAGGLDTNYFDEYTMQSKKHKNLFAIGEILDIDGDCGGFNLAWAWASAFSAAQAVAEDSK